MNQDLDRVKNDVETMQKAMGLAPAMQREWVHWMKRDNWLNLLWGLPGMMLIAFSFLPADKNTRYFGLAPAQWPGILVAVSILAVVLISFQKMTANDGRPASLVREYKRYWGIDAHGRWVSVALMLEIALYFFWAWHSHLSAGVFLSGFFIIAGATYLVLAVVSKLWLLLGVAGPILACGLFQVLVKGGNQTGNIATGMMFLGMGICCYLLQTWQIRQIEHQNESH